MGECPPINRLLLNVLLAQQNSIGLELQASWPLAKLPSFFLATLS